jgi:hypothetical protein
MRILFAPVVTVVGLSGCVHQHAERAEPRQSTEITVPSSTPAPATIQPPSAPMAAATPAEVAKPAPRSGGVAALPPSQPGRVATPPKKSVTSVPGKAPAVAAAAAAPVTVAAAAKPQLDFKSMEQRLRDTGAIGVFTKLSIKNQVDDLLKSFTGYHAGHVPPTLDQLHQRYDGLLLKVVSLVQDDDATLAASISASRAAIWEILSNRESFKAIANS